MRRFFALLVLLLFALPFGVSISGCSKKTAPVFCNGGDSGLTTGVVTTITLLPKIYGISLNYAEIGQVGSPSATDCKGTGESVAAYTYSTSDMTLADVQPTTGGSAAAPGTAIPAEEFPTIPTASRPTTRALPTSPPAPTE
jgi:hypothetical protein